MNKITVTGFSDSEWLQSCFSDQNSEWIPELSQNFCLKRHFGLLAQWRRTFNGRLVERVNTFGRTLFNLSEFNFSFSFWFIKSDASSGVFRRLHWMLFNECCSLNAVHWMLFRYLQASSMFRHQLEALGSGIMNVWLRTANCWLVRLEAGKLFWQFAALCFSLQTSVSVWSADEPFKLHCDSEVRFRL